MVVWQRTNLFSVVVLSWLVGAAWPEPNKDDADVRLAAAQKLCKELLNGCEFEEGIQKNPKARLDTDPQNPGETTYLINELEKQERGQPLRPPTGRVTYLTYGDGKIHWIRVHDYKPKNRTEAFDYLKQMRARLGEPND